MHFYIVINTTRMYRLLSEKWLKKNPKDQYRNSDTKDQRLHRTAAQRTEIKSEADISREIYKM